MLSQGNLAALGDLMMQRFKSVETAAKEKNWTMSQHQELIPMEDFGTTSMREKEVAVKLSLKQHQLEEMMKAKRGPG